MRLRNTPEPVVHSYAAPDSCAPLPGGVAAGVATGLREGRPEAHGNSSFAHTVRQEDQVPRLSRRRAAVVIGGVAACFAAVGAQLVALALSGRDVVRSSMTRPLSTAFARPDIVDRDGRLLATDVALYSLYADPSRVIDVNEAVETLRTLLPSLDEARIRAGLSDKTRQFLWIKRGLSPKLAQEVHNAGLPGFSFRQELTRAYPLGELAGQIVGSVDVDNKGLSGIERHLDASGLVEPVHGISRSPLRPVRLSLHVGVQYALEEELHSAIADYRAKGASGVVMDANTGEVLAAVSLPVPSTKAGDEAGADERIDKVARGTFELGSVFKIFTVAMALEQGIADPNSLVDVTKPLVEDGYTISDPHPSARPISVRDIFVKSSNVGAGILALEAGSQRQKAFLKNAGVLTALETEAGRVAPARYPAAWGSIETVTVSYGHGVAVSPLQFSAAAAGVLNGGYRVHPTFVLKGDRERAANGAHAHVVSGQTSRQLRSMMRDNVVLPYGTGRLAEVAGYRVGGKTGTAELPGRGGYKKSSVIASFLAAFPMEKPQYVVFVSVFEPKPTRANGGKLAAGRNAAPVAARVISRIGPMLRVPADFQ